MEALLTSAAPHGLVLGPDLSPPSPTGVEKLLLSLSGGHVSADVKNRIFRPLFFIALLVCLVLIGLYTLYIKNPTFGADGFADYLGVFIWAVSADVAQRTLQTLQLPR